MGLLHHGLQQSLDLPNFDVTHSLRLLQEPEYGAGGPRTGQRLHKLPLESRTNCPNGEQRANLGHDAGPVSAAGREHIFVGYVFLFRFHADVVRHLHGQ